MKNNAQKLSTEKIMDIVGNEINNALDSIDDKKTKRIVNIISKSKRIFLAGTGRSGLIAEAFAMRLTHLGIQSYISGESITPETKKNDLMIAISGTGTTKITNEFVEQAKKTKTKIILVTANKNSKIGKKADLNIEIKAKTKTNKQKSIEPMGSLFEQATFVYLDSIVISLMKKLKINEKTMKERHSKIK